MICPIFFKKLLLPAFCFFLLLHPGLAQETQPTLTARFPNELGAYFTLSLRNKHGAGLIYKHKISQVKTQKGQKQSALRAVVGLYKDPITNGGGYRAGDTIFSRYSNGNANRYFISLGIERQSDRKKFRFYFGGEVGYRTNVYKSETRVDATVPGATFPYDSYEGEVTSHAPIVSAFVGGNYFIWPHLSIGTEAQFAVDIDFSTVKIIRNGQESSSRNSTIFESNISIIRFLYLSYHF